MATNGYLKSFQGCIMKKIIDPTSIDMNNIPDGVEVRDYNDTVENIKKWMKSQDEIRINF